MRSIATGTGCRASRPHGSAGGSERVAGRGRTSPWAQSGDVQVGQVRRLQAGQNLGGEDGCIAKGLYAPNRVRVVDGGIEAVESALKLNKDGVSGEKVVFRPNA